MGLPYSSLRRSVGSSGWSGVRIWTLGPNSVNAAAIVVGIIAAPRKPWLQRKTTRLLRSHASEHATLATVKPAAEKTNSRRIDSARLSSPDRGMPITSAIR